MMLPIILPALVAAMPLADEPPAQPPKFQNWEGDCTHLEGLKIDLTKRCEPHISTFIWPDGKADFLFFGPNVTVFSFHGEHARVEGDRLAVDVTSFTIMYTMSGERPETVPATGQCRYTPPAIRPLRVACSAKAGPQEFSGSFVSKGEPSGG